MIWQRNAWVIALPCLLFISCGGLLHIYVATLLLTDEALVTGLAVVALLGKVSAVAISAYTFKIWGSAFVIVTLTTNIISTSKLRTS